MVDEHSKNFKDKEVDIVPVNVAEEAFDLSLTNVTEVSKIMRSLKSSKCKDNYQLDTMFIKKHCDFLVPPITHLINLSLTQCIFPSEWKQAIITPIFKSVNRHKASNYRPISILPVLSKIAEKVTAKQLTSYLDTSNFGLHAKQFGFQPNHSPDTATLYLIEQIKFQLHKGWVVGAVFLRPQKSL